MQYIGALDYSLTNCGVAIATKRVTGEVNLHTTTVRSKGKLADPFPVRRRRWRDLTAGVIHAVGVCDLVVIEGIVRSIGPLLDRYITLGFIVDELIEREIPIAVVSPAGAKKAITGTGGADKALMSRCITKLYPDLETANEHESDAAGLVHLGAVALGWNVATLERHKQVKWTEWPEFGPEIKEAV